MKGHIRDILRQIPLHAVTVILLTGVLVSAGIVLLRLPEQVDTPTDEPSVMTYTLEFVNEKGELLKQQEVAAGGFGIPPQLESLNDGIAFLSWNQYLYGVSRSTELRPVYQDVRLEKNAFYMDAQYAQLGENVEAELWLNGIVALSSVELVLEYDPEVLLELECDVGDSPFVVTAVEPGIVTIKLDEDQNLIEPLTVAVVRFIVNEERADIARTTIRIEMKDPKKVTDGGEMGTDCCAVNGDIYLLS